jgi:hypothetical protein
MWAGPVTKIKADLSLNGELSNGLPRRQLTTELKLVAVLAVWTTALLRRPTRAQLAMQPGLWIVCGGLLLASALLFWLRHCARHLLLSDYTGVPSQPDVAGEIQAARNSGRNLIVVVHARAAEERIRQTVASPAVRAAAPCTGLQHCAGCDDRRPKPFLQLDRRAERGEDPRGGPSQPGKAGQESEVR